MPQTRATQARSTSWSLEIVRGRDVGKVFDLDGQEIVLGNRLDGAGGIDLRDQEAGSPRRMAARQAVLEARGSDLIIRDLDSPGGTFVNRRRLLGGQALPLRPGDEIQVGGVLLRVTSPQVTTTPSPAGPPPLTASPTPARPPASSAPGRLPEPFSIDGAVACRSWDDFLVVAAQRWPDLRAELTSGRLADYLRRIRRIDLLPPAARAGSADETLDDWLGRLPVTRSSAPELDVHPDRLEIPATGGTTRHPLRITNVGYRLLRGTARVEPASARWLRIVAPFDAQGFLTIEESVIPIEVDGAELPASPPVAEIVLESNGGSRRVPVSLRLKEGPPVLPDPDALTVGPTIPDWFGSLMRSLAGVRLPVRIASGIVVGLSIRSLVLASGLVPIGTTAAGIAAPRLPALAVLCAGIGVLAGLYTGWRRDRNPFDAVTTGVAAGLLGILAAAVLHALVRTVEGSISDGAPSLWVVGVIWSGLGAAIAAATGLIFSSRGPSGEVTR